MKRYKPVYIFMMLILITGLFAGCGSNTSDNSQSDPAAAAGEEQSGDSKILVVYYSATGTTEAVAQTIADAAGADLFELVPAEPYTGNDLDWTDDSSRVSREHNNESLRNVELTKTTPENWDDYDTVLIGYPIWWGDAAWPVNNFVKDNDFSGKTVIPFCTSASSGIGSSGDILEKLAGTGSWQDGERFSSGASEDNIVAWLNSLGITN